MTFSEQLNRLNEGIQEQLEAMRTQTCDLGSLAKLIALSYTGVGRTLDGVSQTLDSLEKAPAVSDSTYHQIFQTLQKIAQETEKTNRYLEEVAEPYFLALAQQQRAVRADVHDMFWFLDLAVEKNSEEGRVGLAKAIFKLFDRSAQEENQAALQSLIQAPEPDLGDLDLPESDRGHG